MSLSEHSEHRAARPRLQNGGPGRQELTAFWRNNIADKFPSEALSYRVMTTAGRTVQYVNLDNAATTTPFAKVKRVVDDFMDRYGSVHRGSGQKSILSTEAYDNVRSVVRRFVKASDANYALMSKNTTESINQAAELWKHRPGCVLVSDIEHSSNLLPWMKHNEIVQYQTEPDGTTDLNHIEEVLRARSQGDERSRVKVLTVTGSSNITGYSPPVHSIARLAHRYGASIFVDACQWVQHCEVDLKPNDDPEHLDFLVFSGHKMYAPYGAGFMVGPKDFFDSSYPYQIGGGNLPYITGSLEVKRFHTERAHDPGSPNAIGAIAIAQAIELIEEIGRSRIAEYEHALVR